MPSDGSVPAACAEGRTRPMRRTNRQGPEDEGPSEEDLRRFGDDSAFCPDCGAEIWDQADVCPKCFAYLGGDTSRRRRGGEARRRWRTVVVLIVLAAIAVSWVGVHAFIRALG